MASLKDRIKEIILRDKTVNSDSLEKALTEQKKTGKNLSAILLAHKLIDEDTLTVILSEALELPPISISRLVIDPEILKKIPKEIVTKYKVFPISLLGDQLTLAMIDATDIVVIDNIQSLTGCRVAPVLARSKDIEDSIQKYYFENEQEQEEETFDDIMHDIKEGELELVKDLTADISKSSVEELTEEAPIIKLTDTIIQQAVIAKASDVFIEPMEKTVRIRYRVDGVIREIDQLSKVLLSPLVLRIKVISSLDISEKRMPQDGRFKTLLSGDREVDFRVSILPTVSGEKVCLRVLDQDNTVLKVDNLGFEPTSLERLKECAVKPNGFILTCGPTGSGKTTTLYSILKYIDSPEKNIVTVEDPVEFQMKGASQVNIRPSVGLTFSSSLRSILRQDPDVILIGEIRDAETLDIAVKAALTGHLVLSSLHTTTAAGSIIRMMNMGIQPFLISSSVLAIVAQRLIRKICDVCKESYTLPAETAKQVGLDRISPDKKYELYRAKGCKKCFNTGYKGRIGITEILIFTNEIKKLVLARAGEVKIKQKARQEGMKTMREDGLMKALQGLTSLEEVVRITAADNETE